MTAKKNWGSLCMVQKGCRESGWVKVTKGNKKQLGPDERLGWWWWWWVLVSEKSRKQKGCWQRNNQTSSYPWSHISTRRARNKWKDKKRRWQLFKHQIVYCSEAWGEVRMGEYAYNPDSGWWGRRMVLCSRPQSTMAHCVVSLVSRLIVK